MHLKTTTFSNKDSAKTLSICMLTAQRHKDKNNFRKTNNTHGVLNDKCRDYYLNMYTILFLVGLAVGFFLLFLFGGAGDNDYNFAFRFMFGVPGGDFCKSSAPVLLEFL